MRVRDSKIGMRKAFMACKSPYMRFYRIPKPEYMRVFGLLGT